MDSGQPTCCSTHFHLLHCKARQHPLLQLPSSSRRQWAAAASSARAATRGQPPRRARGRRRRGARTAARASPCRGRGRGAAAVTTVRCALCHRMTASTGAAAATWAAAAVAARSRPVVVVGAGGGVVPQARRAVRLPVRPREEARAPRRRQLQGLQLRARGDRQRRRLHEAPPRRELRFPRRFHPRAHR